MTEKVWVQRDRITGEFINECVFNAWYGFDRMGAWTESFTYQDFADGKVEVTPDTIVVGGIRPIREALARMGFRPPEDVDYPAALEPFLGRRITRETIRDVHRRCVDEVVDPPVFVKPVTGQKCFDGHVVGAYRDLIRTSSYLTERPDYPVWVSELVTFFSEHRYFVNRGEVVGVGFYRGDPLLRPDGNVVRQAVAAFEASGEAPVSYCVDFGVTPEGDSLLVEVNDGFAFGSYGLNHIRHANMLEDRWRQLVGRPLRLR